MDEKSHEFQTEDGFVIVADAVESRPGSRDTEIQELQDEVQHWKQKYADLEKEHNETLRRYNQPKPDCEMLSTQPSQSEVDQDIVPSAEPATQGSCDLL
jgi:hypothetical protein